MASAYLRCRLSFLCRRLCCRSAQNQQLIALGITPVEVKGGPDVEDLVAELYGEMSGEPGVMLKRVLMQKAPKEDSRFDEMDDEEWAE